MKKDKPKTAEEINTILSGITENWTSEIDRAIHFKTIGVKSGFAKRGRPLPEEVKRKLSEVRTGKKRSAATAEKLRLVHTGSVRSPETRKRISEAQIGRVVTEVTRKKIAKARIGTTLSEATKEKLRLAHSGKKLSEETKEKIALAKKGTTHSGETRSKMSSSSTVKKAVLVNDVRYESIRAAATALTIDEKIMGYRLKSKSPKWKDYSFIDSQ